MVFGAYIYTIDSFYRKYYLNSNILIKIIPNTRKIIHMREVETSIKVKVNLP